MIVAVGSIKGSPGVTTAALALALAWPGPRVLLDADPSGGDLAFRARDPNTGRLIRDGRGLLSLAADARVGVPPEGLPRYATPTLWGVDVVCGPPSAASYAPMRTLWAGVANAAATWSGVAIADLGRLSPGSPATTLAQHATAVVVLTEVSVESLFHVRDSLPELASQLGDPTTAVNPVAVVMLARRRDVASAVHQTARVLASVGCPVPVLGSLAVAPSTARRLRQGQLTPRMTRGPLLRSAADVAARIVQRWPHLATPERVEAGAP